MYRVLLVDDEILVLKSLEAGVNWRKSGFQVAGKAHNADQALQLAAEIKPHIVFTDIRMPGMSGLELMKKMKETDEQILFVVISGYAEFEYVKKSLHYGVLGYCLKPFDDEEIDVLLHSAAAILEENKLKRQNSLLELLDEGVTEYSQHRVDQILTEAGLTAGEFHVLVALGKGTLELEENDRWVGFKLGNDKYGFFVQFAHPQAFERLLTSRFPDCWMGVGVVTTARDMKSMTKNLELASVRAWDFFLHGRAGYFRGNDPGREAMAARLVKQLTDAVGQKNSALVLELLDVLRLKESKECLTIRDALKIYNSVYFHAFSHPGIGAEEDYVFSNEQLLHLFPNFDEMIESLKALSDMPDDPNDSHSGHGIRNASLRAITSYIHDHYRDNISIQVISKAFYLNANYLSQLFKRELNLTFTEYLTNVRLKQAKHLLLTTELSVREVAESVGFRDYFYFIRVFKKHASQTPRQYKYQARSGLG